MRTMPLTVALCVLLTVSCAGLAPAAPMPSVGAPSGPSLADMEGWWNSSASMYGTWHVASDGSAEMFYEDSGARMSRPAVRMQFQIDDNRLSLRNTGGYAFRGCTHEIGTYGIERITPDSLKLSLIHEPCAERVGWYREAMFTRATVIEQTMGRWLATSQEQCCLTVREDLCYCLQRGQGADAETVIEGTLFWDPAYEHLQFQGMATSPCGPSKQGKYKVVVDSDQVLRLECVEDLCAERRDMLGNWGPFVRDETLTALAGSYLAKANDRYALSLRAGGTFRLRDEADDEGWLLREGTYCLDGNKLLLTDRLGEARCPEVSGEYDYRLENGVLRLEASIDDCAIRSGFFASYADWVLQEQ